MTMHIILTTANRDGFVWITDRMAFLQGSVTTIEKISYMPEQKIAYSIWGDNIAVNSLSFFRDAVNQGAICLDDDETAKNTLHNFTKLMVGTKNSRQPELQDSRGMIVARLGTSPRLYRILMTGQGVVLPIFDVSHAGDPSNPAHLFTRYYYPLCNRTMEELLRLGIHNARLATKSNTLYLAGLDVWVCERGEFRQLGTDELERYIKISESLDEIILKFLSERVI